MVAHHSLFPYGRTSYSFLLDPDLGGLAMQASSKNKNRFTSELARLHEQIDELQVCNKIDEKEKEQLQLQIMIVSGLRESIIATDLNGIITFWAKGAEQLYGYSRNEIVGRPVTTIFMPGDQSQKRKLFEHVRLNSVRKGIFERRRKNGDSFWADSVASLLCDESGRPYGVICIDRDLTKYIQERNRLIKRSSDLMDTANMWKYLYTISRLCDQPGIPFEATVGEIVNLLPSVWRNQLIVGTCAEIDGKKYKSDTFVKTDWKTIRKITVDGKHVGNFEVYYPQSRVHDGIFSCGKEKMDLFTIIAERIAVMYENKKQEESLREKAKELILYSGDHNADTDLNVLMAKKENDQNELKENVFFQVIKFVFPYLEKLKSVRFNEIELSLLSLIESNLSYIISPFVNSHPSKFLNLTPMEKKIAEMVKKGKSTREIADLLHLSENTITTHRNNLRKKLGLKHKKVNLGDYLAFLDG